MSSASTSANNLSSGVFRGEKLSRGEGCERVILWIPDSEADEGQGYSFDFDPANGRIDDLIGLLQQLKAAQAVPVELHTVQSDAAVKV